MRLPVRFPMRIMGVGGRFIRIARVRAMMRVHVGAGVVVGGRRKCDILAGLALIRRARHSNAGSNRMQRKDGHQEPNQECRERAVHSWTEYSTAVFRCDGFKPDRSDGALPADLVMFEAASDHIRVGVGSALFHDVACPPFVSPSLNFLRPCAPPVLPVKRLVSARSRAGAAAP